MKQALGIIRFPQLCQESDMPHYECLFLYPKVVLAREQVTGKEYASK